MIILLVFFLFEIISVCGTLNVPSSRVIAVEKYNGLQTSKILFEAFTRNKMKCTELCADWKECRYLCMGPLEMNSLGEMTLSCSLMDGNWNASDTVNGPCQMYKVKDKAPYCVLSGLLENGDFTALQASTEYGGGYNVNFITMDNDPVDVWCSVGRPDPLLNPEWVTVDFGTETMINAIGFKGTNAFGEYYIKTFQILSSTDGVNWVFYEEGGSPKVFDANSDAIASVVVELSVQIETRYLKVILKEYFSYYPGSSGDLTVVCTYLEIYGCKNS